MSAASVDECVSPLPCQVGSYMLDDSGACSCCEGIACGVCEDGYYAGAGSNCSQCGAIYKAEMLYVMFVLLIVATYIVCVRGQDTVVWGSPGQSLQALVAVVLTYAQSIVCWATWQLLRR